MSESKAGVTLSEPARIEVDTPDGRVTKTTVDQKGLEAIEKAHGGIDPSKTKEFRADGALMDTMLTTKDGTIIDVSNIQIHAEPAKMGTKGNIILAGASDSAKHAPVFPDPKVELNERTHVEVHTPDGKTVKEIIDQKGLDALTKAHGGTNGLRLDGQATDVLKDGTEVVLRQGVSEDKILTQMMQLELAKQGFSKHNAGFGDDGILGKNTRADAKESGKDYLREDGSLNADAIKRDFKEFLEMSGKTVTQGIAVAEAELQKPHYNQAEAQLATTHKDTPGRS